MNFFSCSVLKSEHKRFIQVEAAPIETGVKENLEQFHILKRQMHQASGAFQAETSYDRSKTPHLYMWFQTNEAMVMLLSNCTLQVNIQNTFQPLSFFIMKNHYKFSD